MDLGSILGQDEVTLHIITIGCDTKTTFVFLSNQEIFHKTMSMAKYYPSNWPANPFHAGEVELQKMAGVHESVMSYAPRVVRPFMPQQHLEFYQQQPFLVAAARDSKGNMWSTLLTNPLAGDEADLVHATDKEDLATLYIQGGPVRGDALHGEIRSGSDLGLLGIEFATKRRNRVNGRIVSIVEKKNQGEFSSSRMVFRVDQSFGNCPQYIHPRQWWSVGTTENDTDLSDSVSATNTTCTSRPNQLTADQMATVAQAQTIFVATGYRGEGQDVRYGNDASHRGGPPGFILVQDTRTLILPEFSGNNHFNSLGNLRLDPRMGISIPDFQEGGMLQLSGTAEVEMDSEKAALVYPGALRLITFHVEQVNEVATGSLPIRWSAASEERPMLIKAVVQESEDVKSFYLQPLPQDKRPLWNFQAGQHLPIRLLAKDGTEVWRTYSLSGSPSSATSYYRISVKREALGLASRILHDDTEVGDVVEISRPAGDFVLAHSAVNSTSLVSYPEEEKKSEQDDVHSRTLVLLSSGIGITPLLSMLHAATSIGTSRNSFRRVVWIHGARNGRHHPFQLEVQELKKASVSVPVETHVRYSQPTEVDESGNSHDSKGRIDASLILGMLRNEVEVWHADYFLCGPSSFLSDMVDHLERLGVEPGNIHVESF